MGGSTEIPQAQPSDAPPFSESGEIARYKAGADPGQLQSLKEFVSEGEVSSPIGVDLREARRKLKSGEEADGLLIVNVQDGSPAAQAGLHPFKQTTHNVLTGAAIMAAMAFPPAILVLPVLDYAQIGESYDMIIGVDGARVTNFLDFQDRMRDVQPGELLYLSVVRDGKRLQLAVTVPPSAAQSTY